MITLNLDFLSRRRTWKHATSWSFTCNSALSQSIPFFSFNHDQNTTWADSTNDIEDGVMPTFEFAPELRAAAAVNSRPVPATLKTTSRKRLSPCLENPGLQQRNNGISVSAYSCPASASWSAPPPFAPSGIERPAPPPSAHGKPSRPPGCDARLSHPPRLSHRGSDTPIDPFDVSAPAPLSRCYPFFLAE